MLTRQRLSRFLTNSGIVRSSSRAWEFSFSQATSSAKSLTQRARNLKVGEHILMVSVFGVSKTQFRGRRWVESGSLDLASKGVDENRTCGEDAFVVAGSAAKDMALVGVADGVGGWIESGVDPGIVSHHMAQLLRHTFDNNSTPAANLYPGVLLDNAHRSLIQISREDPSLKIIGSTTAVISLFDTNPESSGLRMKIVNVGDSELVVIRDGQVVFAMPTCMHGGGRNVPPFQLAVVPESMVNQCMTDYAKDGQHREVSNFIKDDIIILGSDGAFDNYTSFFRPESPGYLKNQAPEEKYISLGKIVSDALKAEKVQLEALQQSEATVSKAEDEEAITAAMEGTVSNLASTLLEYAKTGRKVDDITLSVVRIAR